MTVDEIGHHRARALQILRDAGTHITPAEAASIEIAHLGLGRFETEGVAIVVYVNNERYCAKELVLYPNQTCPQHRHPPVGNDPGKTETFRVRSGVMRLYVEGPPTARHAHVPEAGKPYYTIFHEIVLGPGGQYTIPPNTWHWFQAGDEPVVVSEFSSTSRDEFDQFVDPNIRRVG